MTARFAQWSMWPWLIPFSNVLGRLLRRAAERLDDAGDHLRRCESCGRSRYYGGPCV